MVGVIVILVTPDFVYVSGLTRQRCLLLLNLNGMTASNYCPYNSPAENLGAGFSGKNFFSALNPGNVFGE